MSILAYNGAAMIAMAGDGCVGIASDTRLGVQAQTVATTFQKVHKISDTIFVGLAGLGSDVQTLSQTLKFRKNLYELREEREMKPKVFSALLSTLLYEKRFGPYFCEPIVAGLQEGKPFLSGMDLIGAPVFTDDFVVSGTCTANLFGTCESLFKPNFQPDEVRKLKLNALFFVRWFNSFLTLRHFSFF